MRTIRHKTSSDLHPGEIRPIEGMIGDVREVRPSSHLHSASSVLRDLGNPPPNLQVPVWKSLAHFRDSWRRKTSPSCDLTVSVLAKSCVGIWGVGRVREVGPSSVLLPASSTFKNLDSGTIGEVRGGSPTSDLHGDRPCKLNGGEFLARFRDSWKFEGGGPLIRPPQCFSKCHSGVF